VLPNPNEQAAPADDPLATSRGGGVSKSRVHPTDAVIARIARYLLVALLAVSGVVTVVGQTVRGARARYGRSRRHGTAAVGPREGTVKVAVF
jgi:hypothetical protein